jgi:hypothetical protein
MHAIPMQARQATDQQLEALLALMFTRRRVAGGGFAARRRRFDKVHEGVVQEHGVAGGPVDDAVKDMRYDFALWDILVR